MRSFFTYGYVKFCKPDYNRTSKWINRPKNKCFLKLVNPIKEIDMIFF